MAKQLDDWNKILKTFAELAGESEREVTVKAISTGSYLLYVTAGLATAKLIADVIGWAVDLYKKLLELRDLRERFARSAVPAPEVSVIKKHEADTTEQSVAQLVAKMMTDAADVPIEPGRRQELEVQLTLSIRKTIRFIDQGGAIEVTAPPPRPDAPPADGVIDDRARLAIAAIEAHGAAVATLPPRGQPILEIPEFVSFSSTQPSVPPA